MDPNEPSAGEQKAASLRSELKRLNAKLSQTSDQDIRSALQLKIESTRLDLEALEEELKPSEEGVEEAPPEPATPAQIEEAERLIRLAQVEKIRGNKAK